MSMYDILFRTQPSAEVVLAMLRLLPFDIHRYRDAWVGENCLVLLTRQGSDTQENLTQRLDFLASHSNEFDATYRYYHFNIPAQYVEWAGELKKMQHPNPADIKGRIEEAFGRKKR